MGKEAGTSVMHAYQTAVADKAFKPEKEKVCIPLAHKMVNIDLIANNIPNPGKSAMEFNDGIEKPVTPLSFDRMVDTQIRA